MTKLKIGQTIKNIISAINANFSELDSRPNMQYKVLWSGSRSIPSKSDGTTVTITLADSLANYDGLLLQLDGCDAWTYFGALSTGKALGPINQQMGCTTGMSGWNVFGYKCEILSNTSLRLSNFVFTGSCLDLHDYFQIYDTRYLPDYSVYPLVKIIGIKLS